MRISVCSPSYRRPEGVLTLKYLPFAKIYVAPEEAEEYRRFNPRATIVVCPEGVQGSLCRVRNYILDQEFKKGADVVVLLDDDLKGIYYWEKCERQEITADEFLWFIEKYSILAMELGAKFWGVNLSQDKQLYREHTPFSTVSPICGPFQVFLKDCDIRYDERLPLKEDYDLSLQHLNRYRKILRLNKFFYICKQSEQKGGCAAYRNIEREKEQLSLLRKKWGSGIVRVDRNRRSHNLSKEKMVIDYNPVIHVPIKGV